MVLDFKNKKVLVTGGTRGIGAAIALSFLNVGAEVTVTGTSQDSFDELRTKASDQSLNFLEVDFSNLDSTLKLTKKLSLLNFDILVNNAGINKIAKLQKIALEEWQKIQDVNLRGPFLISQAVAEGMKKQNWGRIINIASVFGVVTKEKRLSYTTSKAGLVGMTKTLALELAEHNILVNAISPGFIDTELTRQILSEPEIDEMVDKVPLKKLGQPQDVASLTLFLTSDLNRFITGENILIDGGFTCA